MLIPTFPVTIYYAFKQSETKGDTGTGSTGWETFLAAVIESGLFDYWDVADSNRVGSTDGGYEYKRPRLMHRPCMRQTCEVHAACNSA